MAIEKTSTGAMLSSFSQLESAFDEIYKKNNPNELATFLINSAFKVSEGHALKLAKLHDCDDCREIVSIYQRSRVKLILHQLMAGNEDIFCKAVEEKDALKNYLLNGFDSDCFIQKDGSLDVIAYMEDLKIFIQTDGFTGVPTNLVSKVLHFDRPMFGAMAAAEKAMADLDNKNNFKETSAVKKIREAVRKYEEVPLGDLSRQASSFRAVGADGSSTATEEDSAISFHNQL